MIDTQNLLFYSTVEGNEVVVTHLDHVSGTVLDQTVCSGLWFATPAMDSMQDAITAAVKLASEIAASERANGVVRFTPQLISDSNGRWVASVTMALIRWRLETGRVNRWA